MSQKKRVLDYLGQYGSISSLEAFQELGVTRLSAVIFNLKEEGYEFDVTKAKGKNRFGEKTCYARYHLRK